METKHVNPTDFGRRRGDATSSKQPLKQSSLLRVQEVPQYVRSHSDSFSEPLHLTDVELTAMAERNTTQSISIVKKPLATNQVQSHNGPPGVSHSSTPAPSTDSTSGCCRVQVSDFEPRPSWFLLFFSVIPINMLFGINFISFGLYYVEYVDHFQTTTSAVGVIASLRTGVMSFFGILTSSFLKRYPPRVISMFGGSAMVVSGIINTVAPSIYLLYLSQGVLAGIGGSLLTMTSSILIQQHFHKNRALGGGLGMLGHSLGHLVGPPLINHLIQTYGWRGAQLITSAILGNIIALSATLWQPADRYRVKDITVVATGDISDNEESPGPVIKGTECNDIESKVDDRVSITSSSAPFRKSNACRDFCKDIFNFSYLKNLKFTLFCISGAMARYNMRTFLELGPSKSVSLGMSRSEAAAVISVFSMVGMGARVLSTLLANLKFVNKILYFGAGVMFGAVGSLLTLWHSFSGQAIAGVLHGIHIGFTNTIYAVIIVDLMGIEHLAKCIALFNIFVGSISMCASPLGGFLYDVTGNFDIPFLLAGIASLIAGVIVFGMGFAYESERKVKQTNAQACVINTVVPSENNMENGSLHND